MSSCISSTSCLSTFFLFFFFNDPAPTEIYTLSLHDALPIWSGSWRRRTSRSDAERTRRSRSWAHRERSEEHTSELQSLTNLVCRLLLEKKKKNKQKKKNKDNHRHAEVKNQDKTQTIMHTYD